MKFWQNDNNHFIHEPTKQNRPALLGWIAYDDDENNEIR